MPSVIAIASRVLLVLGLMLMCGLRAEAAPPAMSDSTPPYGIATRTPWTTSRIIGSPEPPPPFKAVRAFPNLKFDHPLLLTKVPGTNRLLVIQEGGRIFTFLNDQACTKADLFIDMDAEYAPICKVKDLKGNDNTGIEWVYGLAFDPKFRENRYVYICFVFEIAYSRFNVAPGTRVSRFRVTDTDPPRVDPKSELPIIEWKKDGHNGGCLVFGPDGYLYIGTGDGGGATPPDYLNTGQSIDDLLSSILRIDVHKTEGKRNYAIPADNPFVNVKGARGELWAYGLRNPWRMSFDKGNDNLWVGDVGWEAWEMVYKIERGGNYGWSVMEGPQPARIDAQRGPTPILPPTAAHNHSEAASVTGGFVYYGKRLPGLNGAYVYGDYETGKMWALRYDNKANKVTEIKEIADTKVHITSFGEDIDEEIYMVGYEGTVHKLVPADGADRSRDFPRKLSDTGLFANLAKQQPAAGVVPFSINAEMWSDGATAQRWVAIPGNATARLDGQPPPFPKDGVLVKTLSLNLVGGRRPIETQVLHFDGQVWHGYSYAWNDQATDATLVDAQGSAQAYKLADRAGAARTQTWHFGSRAECVRCHNNWAQYRLAFTLPQLNRDHDYGGVVDNQLRTLGHIGLVQLPPTDQQASGGRKPPVESRSTNSAYQGEREGTGGSRPPLANNWPRYANPRDNSATLDARARAYLHVNCSHCHRYGGGGTASFQVQHELPAAGMGIIDRAPAQGTFGLDDAKIVASAHPNRSVLLYRMAKLGGGRMPHIGSDVVDADGLRLIRDWISQLPTPAGQSEPPPARPRTFRTLLDTPTGAMQIVAVIDSGQWEQHDAEQLTAAGCAHGDSRVRDLFERFLSEEARPRRLGPQINAEALLVVKGDAARGRALFTSTASVSCRNCHQIGKDGGQAGPVLDQIGKKLNRAQILESILEPSKTIEEKYITYLVVNTDGVPRTGVLVQRTPESIELRDAENKSIRLKHSEIEELTRQRQSLMPEGLLSNLTAQQAADLLSYLESLK